MNPCERAAFVTSIACAIFKSCSQDEVKILIGDLNQLSNTLGNMLVQADVGSKKDNSDEIEDIGDFII